MTFEETVQKLITEKNKIAKEKGLMPLSQSAELMVEVKHEVLDYLKTHPLEFLTVGEFYRMMRARAERMGRTFAKGNMTRHEAYSCVHWSLMSAGQVGIRNGTYQIQVPENIPEQDKNNWYISSGDY